MKVEIRLIKVIFALADIGVILICIAFATDVKFQDYLLSSLQVFSHFPPVAVFTTPAPFSFPATIKSPATGTFFSSATNTNLRETAFTPTQTAFVTLEMPMHTETPSKEKSKETIRFDFPSSPDWIPSRYSFSYPSRPDWTPSRYSFYAGNIRMGDAFAYGDPIFYRGERNYKPEKFIHFVNLDPDTILEGVNIFYPIINDKSVRFQQYLLGSDASLTLLEQANIVNRNDGITCVEIMLTYHSEDIYRIPYYYCYVQSGNRLIVTDSLKMEMARKFLFEYLAGKLSGEYQKYFPSMEQFIELERQLGIASCSMTNGYEEFGSAWIGEEEHQVEVYLDVISITARLACSIYEEGMEGLNLTILSVENRWMMDRIIKSVYERNLLDIRLYRLTETYVKKEGPLIIWYTEQGANWVKKQIGNSMLTLEMEYSVHMDISKNPTEYHLLLSKIIDLAKQITYPEIDVTQIAN